MEFAASVYALAGKDRNRFSISAKLRTIRALPSLLAYAYIAPRTDDWQGLRGSFLSEIHRGPGDEISHGRNVSNEPLVNGVLSTGVADGRLVVENLVV